MIKFQRFRFNLLPWSVVLVSLLAAWNIFAPPVVAHQVYYLLSSIALFVISISHAVLLFQENEKPFMHLLYSIAIIAFHINRLI